MAAIFQTVEEMRFLMLALFWKNGCPEPGGLLQMATPIVHSGVTKLGMLEVFQTETRTTMWAGGNRRNISSINSAQVAVHG